MANDDVFDRYETVAPSAQNAVDAVPGWTTAFPAAYGLTAGKLHLAEDSRIAWLLEQLADVEGQRILELGPLDGGHTAMLHEAGAARIDAIEANRLAFLRCLILKEVMGLDRARFHLGDFCAGFGPVEGRCDLVVASGVLYHLADPLELLARISAMTDTLYIWTHVVISDAIRSDDPRRVAFTGKVVEKEVAGCRVRLHQRGYRGAQSVIGYCGGIRNNHFWMERDDLLKALRTLGFDNLQCAHEQDDPAHSGPSLSILARRSPG